LIGVVKHHYPRFLCADTVPHTLSRLTYTFAKVFVTFEMRGEAEGAASSQIEGINQSS
jgi:hypothetical protein